MRKFILLFFLLYVAKYGNSMPVSQSTLLSVRRMIHALPRCDNVCLFLWLLFQDAGVCQLCQLCHGKKIIVLPQRDHIPAGNRARTSIASGLHRPFIGWLLCDYWVVIVRYVHYVCAIFSYSNHYLYQNI